jgi:hypothetical protein
MTACRHCGKYGMMRRAFGPRFSNLYRCVLVIGFCSLLAGCGGRSDLGLVTGRVTLDGKPVADAAVEFTPTTEGSIATGRTDSSGEYSLMFSRDVAGASLGENVVRISTFDVDYVEGKGEVSIPERIPAKYNRNSELKVTVEPGKNRHDFDLDSQGANVSQPRLTPGL